jgi:dephospho-CoA kinase
LTYRIGLTGNIGCGKSAVGAMLRELGADYVDADQLVHQLLAAGSEVVPRIVERFGPEVQTTDGGIDRRRLGAIVFADPAALRDLEGLLHPAVRVEILARLAASRAPAIVVDAIKLIEGGLYQECDAVWVVTCDPAEQRRRLIEQRGLTPADTEARIGAQPPQEQKLAYAQVVIDNGGTLAATRAQVQQAWDRIAGVTMER